ncbi:protein of unknown function [Bradyrhizobium vignae]|uniref:Uncharacterized protein n=1 Tax=Bradyrhizobium vignae TaxID=1549949 RepID=A0A2U3PU03_9BRAD|nr:protein of unknown function [Bradyrhizobium vignae]
MRRPVCAFFCHRSRQTASFMCMKTTCIVRETVTNFHIGETRPKRLSPQRLVTTCASAVTGQTQRGMR